MKRKHEIKSKTYKTLANKLVNEKSRGELACCIDGICYVLSLEMEPVAQIAAIKSMMQLYEITDQFDKEVK